MTAQPNDQSTALFAAISAMVGVLLALNAMLLTIPERRRFVAELSMQGFDPRQVLLILAFEALLLGTVASLLGLALGDVLSRTLFDQVPAYLAFAFPIGTQRIVTTSVVAARVRRRTARHDRSRRCRRRSISGLAARSTPSFARRAGAMPARAFQRARQPNRARGGDRDRRSERPSW